MKQRTILAQRTPDIDYPCTWEYTVIGSDRSRLEEAIFVACAPDRPAITLSNVSSSGTYCSLNVSLVVADERTRLAVFARLEQSPAVKVVL